MDDDPYGHCHELEEHAVKALNRSGLASFITAIGARFDAVAATPPSAGSSARDDSEYLRRRWGAALRTLYIAQRNVHAYLAIAEETVLTAKDCHALGTMLAARRRPEDALGWVERGLELAAKDSRGSMAGYDLACLERQLLLKLGRGREALEAAWAEYRKHPNKYAYDDLMKQVPAPERPGWHEKAVDAAANAELADRIALLVAIREIDRLAELVGASTEDALEAISHYVTGPAARKLQMGGDNHLVRSR